ncbi:MAG: STAS domain-containing protein [Spirochaetes bacterium]|nr:STAS domain-containing protein [Spirochaetota bacterium]
MINVIDKGDGLAVLQITIPEVLTLDVPDLKEKIQQKIINNNIKKLVIDLAAVNTITSSGIGIFLNINESLKSNLRLASPSYEVKKVLELTKVSSVVKIFETVELAAESFN